MSLQSIIQDIKTGAYRNDELNRIAEAIRFARADLARETKRQLSQGTTVQFTSGGRVFYGTIVSIKIKNAVVDTSAGRYRVPMNMLTVARQVSE